MCKSESDVSCQASPPLLICAEREAVSRARAKSRGPYIWQMFFCAVFCLSFSLLTPPPPPTTHSPPTTTPSSKVTNKLHPHIYFEGNTYTHIYQRKSATLTVGDKREGNNQAPPLPPHPKKSPLLFAIT